MNIDGGFTTEAVQSLTGAPTAYFQIQDEKDEQNFRRILEGERKDYIMCASTGDLAGTGNDDKDDETGLAGNHAYSLLAAYEVARNGNQYDLIKPNEPKSNNSIWLLKIRNPWGSGEWTGNWRDNDPKWNPTLMKQVGHVKSDDGVFFMEYKDFKTYFEDFSITYYHPNYFYCATQLSSVPSKDTTINFDITTAGDYYFSIYQVNSRHFTSKDDYCYSTIKLVISRIENGQNKYVGMVQNAEKEMFFKACCTPGKYIAVVEAKWRRNVNQFVFSTYGTANVNLGNAVEASVPDSYMLDILIQKARAEPTKFLNFQEKGYANIFYRFEHSNDGFGYFYFLNQNPTATLSTTVDLQKFTGCKLLSPFSGKKPCVTVLPGEEKLIAYKIIDRSAEIKFEFISAFKEGTNQLINDAKTKGFRYDRLMNNYNVGINAYILNHQDGILYYYENLSNQYVLKESLEFELINARLEAVPGKMVNIDLRPGQTYIINAMAVVKGEPFGIKITNCRFNVESMTLYPAY